MNLEKLLGLQDGYLKRLADFYYPLEVKDSNKKEINSRSALIPNPSPNIRRREFNACTYQAREGSLQPVRKEKSDMCNSTSLPSIARREKRPSPSGAALKARQVRFGNKTLTDEGGKGCPPTQKHLEVQP